ncbi:Hypothetical protein KLENKIAIHU_805 [Klenkia terrae]|nr:Hypothetical protein KLENKIAIHU_805 [Klenkia terrae]
MACGLCAGPGGSGRERPRQRDLRGSWATRWVAGPSLAGAPPTTVGAPRPGVLVLQTPRGRSRRQPEHRDRQLVAHRAADGKSGEQPPRPRPVRWRPGTVTGRTPTCWSWVSSARPEGALHGGSVGRVTAAPRRSCAPTAHRGRRRAVSCASGDHAADDLERQPTCSGRERQCGDRCCCAAHQTHRSRRADTPGGQPCQPGLGEMAGHRQPDCRRGLSGETRQCLLNRAGTAAAGSLGIGGEFDEVSEGGGCGTQERTHRKRGSEGLHDGDEQVVSPA